MQRLLSYGLLLLLSLLLASCRTTTIATTETNKTDSIVSVRYIERTIRDTIQVQLPIERNSVTVTTDTSVLSTSFAKSTAWTDTLGLLHHTIENLTNTLPVVIDRVEVVRDSIVYRDRDSNNYKSISRKGLSPMVTFCIGFAIGILVISIFVLSTRKK